MKLIFEKWVETMHFGKNVNGLFNEVFICYKNGAYRASLLFSYIAFLTIIKESLLKTNKPVSVDQGRWESITKKLMKDEQWEKAIYDEIVNNSNPIFNCTDDIRQQVKYWKDRRNDCAHFKSNKIEAFHSDAFWSFVRSNISKITIEGGRESLLKKFKDFFDPNLTPPSADITQLIKEIDEAVESADLSSFWNELLRQFDPYGLGYSRSSCWKVFDYALQICNDSTKESLVDYLKVNKYDLVMIFNRPDKISYFYYDKSEIRQIWRTRIWQHKHTVFKIYGTLLLNNLIPNDQLQEAHQFVISNIVGYRPEDESTHLALSSSGFGEVLYRVAFESTRLSDYLWVNDRADLITYFIEKYPLQDLTVEVICEMYGRSNYSWWLDERLPVAFNANLDLKAQFHSKAIANGWTIPDSLA